MTGALLVTAGNPEVDEVRAATVDDDVARGDVSVDDALPVQFGGGEADVGRDRCRLLQTKSPLLAHELPHRDALDVVVDHDEAVGQPVRGEDPRHLRARDLARRAPRVGVGELARDVLADEQAVVLVLADHELGPAGVALGEHLLDLKGVIKIEGLFELGVIHGRQSSGSSVRSPMR